MVPVVTDPKKVLLALRWVIDEMEKRYKMFAKTGVRNITSFNARPKPKTQAELDAEAEARRVSPVRQSAPECRPRRVQDELPHRRRAGREGDADDPPISTHARPAPRATSATTT